MLDVGDPSTWARVLDTAGPFDIAFLNAGVSTRQGLPPLADGLAITSLKHAVVGFVRSIAASLSDPDAPDICISAICPGFTDTDRALSGSSGRESNLNRTTGNPPS